MENKTTIADQSITNRIELNQKTFCITCEIETYGTRHCYPCYIAWYENYDQK